MISLLRKYFYSTRDNIKKYNSLKFEVVRELTDGEKDPQIGAMYKIRLETGIELDVFEDEIYFYCPNCGGDTFEKIERVSSIITEVNEIDYLEAGDVSNVELRRNCLYYMQQNNRRRTTSKSII